MPQIVLSTPFERHLIVELSEEGITSSCWSEPGRVARGTAVDKAGALAQTVANQVQLYLKRRLAQFDLPLLFKGSAFDISIWKTVTTIPFGMRASYGRVAEVAGHPGAHRGVARAMSDLDFALFVPAHRVVGADGKIKGSIPGSMRSRLLDFESEGKLENT